jgi:hypothetical protein
MSLIVKKKICDNIRMCLNEEISGDTHYTVIYEEIKNHITIPIHNHVFFKMRSKVIEVVCRKIVGRHIEQKLKEYNL